MRKRPFTDLQLFELRRNPTTYTASRCEIRFRASFRKTLVQRYDAGESVKEIFESCGYDLETIGRDCVYATLNRARKALARGEILTDGPRCKNSHGETAKSSYAAGDRELATIEHELIYLRQEMEFLKKILIQAQKEKPER